jgi:hypothetical protein
MTDHPKRIANLLNATPELLREFLAHLSKPDDELLGESSGGNRLRSLPSSRRATAGQALPVEPVTLAPTSRLIVPLRLVFAADDPLTVGFKSTANQAEEPKQAEESFKKIMARPPGTMFRTEIYSALRGNTRGKKDTYVIRKLRESVKPPSYPTRSDFAFGPEWALTGLTVGTDAIMFETNSPNVILITASNEAGSCPILYAWNAREETWIRHGKVLHEAQRALREGSETVQFDGLVNRYRIAEEELERATIRHVSLQLELHNGRILTLAPQELNETAQNVTDVFAEVYANDNIDVTFALPTGIDGTQVKSSSFTVSGYYDRYSELLSTAMVRRRFVTGVSIHVGSSQPARA